MARRVEDFKLTATVFPDRTEQLVYNSGQSCGVQPRVTTETWTRQKKEIGYGGHGTIFLEQTNCGKKRVVKQVAQVGGSDKLSGYMKELKAMVGLSSNKDLFVELIGWFPSESYIYIAMEYLPLKDIEQCYTESLSEPEVKDVSKQLLEGLKMMHENGITHRDIKPQNILVVQKFPIWVKIADFGISKQIQGDDTFLKTWTGTIPFMAPEFYIPNQKYTSAVDVWSLGCVLYFLLTKCHPFPDPGQVIRYGYREAELPKGNLKDRKVSDAGIRFIEGLMAPKPNDRTKVSRALNDPWIGDQSQSTQFLLQKGFDTSAVDFNANKALLLAAAKDYKGDIVRLLLWKGASIATTTYGWTALHHAADKGHEAVVRSLLERGADVATKNNYGCTALHRAACHGHEAVVLLLLEKGGAVAAKTALLWTALHLAAYKGHERVVRLLLEKGADAKAKTFTGQTALRMAARNGHEAVVKLLTPLTPDS